MPKVDHEKFIDWCENNFDKVRSRGSQIQLNSIFCEDKKMKLYCNTNINSFHCFKSEESGNLFKLVMLVENCDYQAAIGIITSQSDIHIIDEKLMELFKPKTVSSTFNNKGIADGYAISDTIQLPDNTYIIDEMSVDNPFRTKVINYLNSRKLKSKGLQVCCGGKCSNRLIIPYYSHSNHLLYWNARTLINAFPKYLFPDNQDRGKGDFIYVPTWHDQKTMYVCEGELNALTLSQCGLFACAVGGKEITDKQVKLLRKYDLVMCFDNDKSGKHGTYKSAKKLLADNKREQIHFVFPSENDWNDLLKITDETHIKDFIEKNTAKFDDIIFKANYLIKA